MSARPIAIRTLHVLVMAAAAFAQDQPVPRGSPEESGAGRAVEIERAEGKLVVRFGDELFTEYRFADGPRPYLYPVLGPGGTPMTRGFPMDPHPGEEEDHPHHRSLWIAHGSVNGFDFWAGRDHAECIVQEEILEVRSGARVGMVRVENRWMADGQAVCREERTLSFFETDEGRVLDVDLVLAPEGDELLLGDTKEGTMAIRTVPALNLKGAGAQGQAKNSAGDRDAACWGKRAAWIDYWAPIDGRVLGVLILDHPRNFAHPTWWHARDYGLVAANPFGVHDFEGEPAGTGDRRVARGESLRLRYRFLFHEGEIDAARAARQLEDFAAGE